MAVELATAYVSLTASAKGIGGSIANELNGELRGVGDKAGAEASSGFIGKFGGGLGALKGVAIAAGATFAAAFAAAIGAGVILEGIGADFDSAFDDIRVRTGATGDELAGLEGSFRNVFSKVPASMGDTSSAIAGLEQRLGLSGKPLEDLSTQFLNLSRITGTDLGQNIDTVTGLFNQFGIKAGEQTGALDGLFRISQETGVSVGDLASQMTDSGTVFREVGLDFEESAALLGLLGESGLSVSDVLPAVNRALATAAKEGRPAADVFRETFDAIKNAPDDVSASALALEVFGAKAGPKFAALVRDGKLGYEDFAAAIAAGDETINNAAAATDDWREKLNVLKNKALLALEPIAARVFSGITSAVEVIGPKIQAAAQQFIDGFKGIGDSSSTFSRIGEVTAQVVAVVQREWPRIQKIIGDVLTTTGQVVSGFVEFVQVIWANFGSQIMAGAQAVWNGISSFITGALQIIRGVVQVFTSLIKGDWSGAWNGIKQIVSGAITIITGAISSFIGRVKAVLSVLGEILVGIFRGAWDRAKAAVKAGVDLAIGVVKTLPGLAVSALAAVPTLLVTKGGDLIRGFMNGIRSLIGGYVTLVGSLPGRALSALGAVGGLLFSAGADLIRGFLRGVRSMAGEIAGAVISPIKSAVSSVRGFLGIGSPSKLFKEIGIDTMRGLELGLAAGANNIRNLTVAPSVGSLTGALSAMSPTSSVSAPAAPVVITGNTFIGSGPEVTRLLSAKIQEGRRAGVAFLGT
jgi:phage-related minor tail protein